MARMKYHCDLCFDARMIGLAGIGRYVQNILLFGLRQASYSVKIIINKKSILLFPWLRDFDYIVCNAPIYSVKEQVLLPIKIPRCKVFWSPHFNVPLLPIRAQNRLVTIHDVYHLAFAFSLSYIERKYSRLLITNACKKSSQIITDSDFSKEEILKYLPSISNEKITRIYLGVDKNQFIQEENILSVNEKYNLPTKYILFVGNAKPHKNLEVLIKAFNNLKDKDVGLVIVGESKGFKNGFDLGLFLKKYQNLKDKVYLLGKIADFELNVLYQLSTAVIIPSLYEGFGLPAVEAMACNSVLIVSKAASLPEVCQDAAIYFDPYSITDLTHKIDKLIKDNELQEELRENGKKRLKLFDWEKCVNKHNAMIKNLLEGI